MDTHVMSMRDEDDRLYHAVVIAPDHRTARRILAMRMLEEHERSLAGSREASLDDYAPEGALEDDWRAEDSVNCTACGDGRTRPLENIEMASMGIPPLVHAGKAHVCLNCAATWIATGTHAPLREELEARATDEIARLDRFERQSLQGER